ncbi:YARHG domain-containing protein [Flavobacterium sp. '19STA2R22 D10 B1']|uniref:YARHG domain-containing protein n=1 Tax=Flavobacterium aerium TaxID=3037261 RepID=UPI00278C4242|nr:YARHG domain-containing protein [Flavobacterium sp. '19STA2R22 D10 B1']
MKQILYLSFLFFCFKGTAQILKDCSTCSTQIIKSEQIKNLSIDEIRLLINEIFARNGYQFENSRFQNYFEEKSWYKSKNDNKSVLFNKTEKQNISYLQEVTKSLKAKQGELINQIKLFKEFVLTNRTKELKSQFGFFYENQTGDDEPKSLKKVLNKINLDDINYYKNKGLNSVMEDNGFVKIVYELSIEGESINFYYNYMSHSKIIEGFDVFTDYHSEEEYMYNWQFEFTNGKLKFIRLAVAG